MPISQTATIVFLEIMQHYSEQDQHPHDPAAHDHHFAEEAQANLRRNEHKAQQHLLS